MLFNYLKTTWRSWRKLPGFTAINVVGLSAGLTCFAFIALWVMDEVRYDRFHRKYERIVRVTTTEKTASGTTESARTGALVANALHVNYADIESTVRLRKHSEEIVHYQQRQTLQPNILLTEPSFFTVFSYSLTRGDPATALQKPYSVILTESTAKHYFGNADPIGQVLTIFMYDSTGRGANYTVTGLMPDPPQNAHFTFTMLGSLQTVAAADPDLFTTNGWTDAKFYTYLLLTERSNLKAFSDKLTQFYAHYQGRPSTANSAQIRLAAQPLRDIHLRSRLAHEIAPNGDVQQVYIFSTIGLFILLLAGINYTNLTTARSASRAKEVGIKKVVGAASRALVAQYVIESVCTALLALLCSGVVALLLQPFFRALTGKAVSLYASPLLLLLLTGVTLLVGVLSGLYPAFVLSSFKPISVMKGSFSSGSKGVRLRQALVVVQFVVTLLLVTSLVIIHGQMRYVQYKDLGYNQRALLFIRVNGNVDVVKKYGAFEHEVAANPLIAGLATSNSMIATGLDTEEAQTTDGRGKTVPVTTARLEVDTNYLTVYGVKLLAGTPLIVSRNSVRQVLLNESAVKRFGWPNAQAAIGKPFAVGGQPGTIVGVVRDFHFNTLQHTIEPLAISLRGDHFSRIAIRVDAQRVGQCLSFIKTAWTTHFPDALFDYAFLDNMLGQQYEAEARFSTLITCFSILSLMIACLGLYGLIAHSTAQRTKEIGIRKTLGASVSSLVVLLSQDLLMLVVLASLIAAPTAWFVMNGWLQTFAYKITPAWWMFAVSVLCVLLVALSTVSFQSIKAALMDPVKSLRSE